MKVDIVIKGSIELPDDQKERDEYYSKPEDVRACVQEDWDGDPAAFLCVYLTIDELTANGEPLNLSD